MSHTDTLQDLKKAWSQAEGVHNRVYKVTHGAKYDEAGREANRAMEAYMTVKYGEGWYNLADFRRTIPMREE